MYRKNENSLDNLIDIFFKDFFDTAMTFEPLNEVHYPVNVTDLEDKLEIEIAAIGAEKEDVNVQIKDGSTLRVKYTKPEDEDVKNEESKRYVNKIAKRSFNFGWKIPPRFDLDLIEAKLKNGLLTIIIPRKEKLKPKKIKVS